VRTQFHVVSVFYFRDVRTPEIKQSFFRFSRPPAVLFNCSFISDVRTSLKQNTETIFGLFQPHYSSVGKYANEAKTVPVFYFTMCDWLYPVDKNSLFRMLLLMLL